MKKCDSCKQEKSLEEFHKNKCKKDGYQNYCKICGSKQQMKYYYNNKDKYIKREYQYNKNKTKKINKLKEKCAKCGDSRNYILDFHHLDASKKLFHISDNRAYGWGKILEEIKKCIILCKNCHHEFHYLEKTQKITIKEYIG